MTIHSLVLISDSFSCNCNSIQSPVSIVHLRVNLILSHPLLRLYISYSISNANQFTSNLHSNVSRSIRINSSSVHTYIFVCFTLRVILQGFVTQNATTIRCCSQHLMVGVNFFLTSSPILDLGHFSQVILPIVLQIMPQPKNNPNHQVLRTASDGWG